MSHRWGGTWEFDYVQRAWRCPTGRHVRTDKPVFECDCRQRAADETATRRALLDALERATARTTGREIELPDNMTAEDVRRAVRDHVREELRRRLARRMGMAAVEYRWDTGTRSYWCPSGLHRGLHRGLHPLPKDPCECVRRRVEFLRRHPGAVLKPG